MDKSSSFEKTPTKSPFFRGRFGEPETCLNERKPSYENGKKTGNFASFNKFNNSNKFNNFANFKNNNGSNRIEQKNFTNQNSLNQVEQKNFTNQVEQKNFTNLADPNQVEQKNFTNLVDPNQTEQKNSTNIADLNQTEQKNSAKQISKQDARCDTIVPLWRRQQKSDQPYPKFKHKHWSKYKPQQKYSIGIACIKIEKTAKSSELKILMINKRHTYAFSDFVNGKYPSDFMKNPQSKAHIMKMLNSMTVAEKLDIISMNFDQMWYRLWSNGFMKSHSYLHAKHAFETTFGSQASASKLKKMITKSKHAQIVWEIPKGRKKNKTETDLNCAVREFGEETGIVKSDYKIIPGLRKSYSFIDEGVQYNYTYFIAISKHDVAPTISFESPEQINEVSDIKWLNIEGVRFVDIKGDLEPFVRGIFRGVSRIMRKAKN